MSLFVFIIKIMALSYNNTDSSAWIGTHDKGIVRFKDSKSDVISKSEGFTSMSSLMDSKKLDEIFMAFDDVIESNNLEKIKTIGDAYMCASWIPEPNVNQVENIVLAGLQLIKKVEQFNIKQHALNEPEW